MSARRISIAWLCAAVLGMAAGFAGSCKDDWDCGERNLPGTEGCPCLRGGTCAADLVCEGGVCWSLQGSSGGGTSSAGTTGTPGSSGSGSASGSGSDTGTGGAGSSG